MDVDTAKALVVLFCVAACGLLLTDHENLTKRVERRVNERTPVTADTRLLWMLGSPCCCLGWLSGRFAYSLALAAGGSGPSLEVYLIFAAAPLSWIVGFAAYGPTCVNDLFNNGEHLAGITWGVAWTFCVVGLRGAFLGLLAAFTEPMKVPLRWLQRSPGTWRGVLLGVAVATLVGPQLVGPAHGLRRGRTNSLQKGAASAAPYTSRVHVTRNGEPSKSPARNARREKRGQAHRRPVAVRAAPRLGCPAVPAYHPGAL